MGGCCSKEEVNGAFGFKPEEEESHDDDDHVAEGDGGARVRLKGSCRFASMFTQQGRKGVNQDAMAIWEDFNGNKDKIFCGVFDGHGPLGHKVASHVRDVLPSKLSAGLKSLSPFDLDGAKYDLDDDEGDDTDSSHVDSDGTYPYWFTQWKAGFLKAFEEMDRELGQHSTIDCICSGSTAVSIVKQREHLIIANLGDSRAILCTRDDKNQLVPQQLTVDLKPNLPSESERITSCKGRVFALDEEPDVHRVWLPDEDCPGLAMARAFGDFCLKDFGLISTPQVSYRRLTEKDECVVLATDGIWDVLSNKEVVKIVSSVRKRSEAAKQLVDRAVRAWKCKHPTSKVDDCAVICLFLKALPSSTKPSLDDPKNNIKPSELSSSVSFKTAGCKEADTIEKSPGNDSKEVWTALEGVSRVNSLVRVPRFSSVLSWKR